MYMATDFYIYADSGDMDVVRVFAERLRELRKSRGLFIEHLEKELKVSNASISRWENGKQVPTIIQLYNIAKYFGVSTDYLVGLED